jgi:hypothetical protein
MAAVPTMLANKEPIASFRQGREIMDGLQEIIIQYDWEDTGADSSELEPNLQMILTPQAGSIYQGGKISLSTPRNYGTSCDWMIGPLIGSVMAQSMCWAYNIMEYYGYTPYVSLWVNISSLILLALYITKKWIDTTTSA